MSSKQKTSGTKEDGKPALVPKLRFPAFREKDEWNRTPIGPYLVDCSDRVAPDTALPIYSSTREGLRRQDDYFDGRVLQNKNEYGVVPMGCLVYRHMSDDGLFKFNINNTGSDIAVSKEYPVFTTKNLDAVFLLAKLNNDPDFKQFALSQKAGGTRTRLYFSRLCEWVTPLPTFPEQQKIAECLSSVDEVIAAQARKVDALKAYKQGLMQQLFAREGESIPRVRFPEFQDSGEWETKTIGDIFKTTSGGTPDRSKMEYWNGSIPWVTTSLVDFNVIKCADEFITNKGLKNSSAKMLPKNTVLVALIGQGKTRGKVALLDIEASTNQNCAGILPNEAVLPSFTFLNLCGRYEEIRALSNTAGQGSLSQGLIRTLRFCAPSDKAEQQRIVTCLTSLDTLIVAETQKMEALKRHKRGLMQQLFPSQEEVAA